MTKSRKTIEWSTIYECTGCGRTSLDPEVDLENMRADGKISCCPDRHIKAISQIPTKFAEKLAFFRPLSVDPGKVDGPCWLWQGRRNRNGYGRVRWLGKEPVVHRLIFELVRMVDIPDKHVLDHRCEIRNCCNPGHLEPVTVKVNTHRGKAKLFQAAYKYAKEKGRI